MFTHITIRKNQYYDSVFLMGVNNRLSSVEGVLQSAVFMGSDANKEVLTGLGFNKIELQDATANDLIVGVISETQSAIDEITKHLEGWLTEVTVSTTQTQIRSLGQALETRPDSNLVVISVPGEYAAAEARKSLQAGKSVFLFSDNVSIEDEIELKKYASKQGLLVMGPDCGTSLFRGVGIGFANAVRRGNIGVIAAAGTGLQEFTCGVHQMGFGISHGIGTGGRDLSDSVGGLTTLTALKMLESDPSTQVIAIISKPPGINTLQVLSEKIRECKKPVVCCFLGIDSEKIKVLNNLRLAETIDDTVRKVIKALGVDVAPVDQSNPVGKKIESGKFLRGVFAGGTFCYQSQQILKKAGFKVFSNTPLEKTLQLESPNQSYQHSIIDMGDEYFLVGRPHPMIDSKQRALRILQEAKDPDIGILLLDFILGYNASNDPVGELIESIQKAQSITKARGYPLEVVASVCGTENDFQDLEMQKKILLDAGVRVLMSNAEATKYCIALMKGSHD